MMGRPIVKALAFGAMIALPKCAQVHDDAPQQKIAIQAMLNATRPTVADVLTGTVCHWFGYGNNADPRRYVGVSGATVRGPYADPTMNAANCYEIIWAPGAVTGPPRRGELVPANYSRARLGQYIVDAMGAAQHAEGDTVRSRYNAHLQWTRIGKDLATAQIITLPNDGVLTDAPVALHKNLEGTWVAQDIRE
jgi:hypothetical protein